MTFKYNGGLSLGVCDGGEIIDLSLTAADLPTELVDLIKLGPSGLDRVRLLRKSGIFRSRKTSYFG